MFGAVNSDNPATAYFSLSNEVRVMDINKWSWVTSVSALTPEALSTTANNGGDSKDSGSQGNNTDGSNQFAVSTGTIVGIVVGGVAGLAIIAGLFIFFFIRRRKNRKLEEKDYKYTNDRMPPNEKEHSQRNGSTSHPSSKDQHIPLIIQGQPPVFHRTEKPDGLLSVNRDHDVEYSLPRAMVKSVKPDSGA
ncbi:hypothetical protein INT45_006333 [Circinella minor]|uniref:Mid2 domain-containing protein n=1 Tax=Circinella minor TaxID=1195481 RepID=A0A8H7VJ78_9FUNG|nr:hypothetical protein INT45_006333 [Circinella minor]